MHLLPVHDDGPVLIGAGEILCDELIEETANLGGLEDHGDGREMGPRRRQGVEVEAVGHGLPCVKLHRRSAPATGQEARELHVVLHQKRPFSEYLNAQRSN
jgi:hypothetical protein